MSSTSRNILSGAIPRGTLALVAAFLIVPSAAIAQDDVIPRRLDRKISVMEKVLNEVLRESPHWLVGGGSDYTRSVYLEEFGVIFSFDASLVDRDDSGLDLEGLSFLKDLRNIRIETDGDKVVVFRDSDKDSTKDDEQDKGLTFDELRRINTVFAVALGFAKARAVVGALRTGVVDVLCTDDIAAGEALRIAGIAF